jgi:hypothetical protein
MWIHPKMTAGSLAIRPGPCKLVKNPSKPGAMRPGVRRLVRPASRVGPDGPSPHRLFLRARFSDGLEAEAMPTAGVEAARKTVNLRRRSAA